MKDVPGTPPREQLLVGVARLGQALRISNFRNAGPYRLSPLQADILTLLAGDPRPRRLSDLTAMLASTPPTISDAAKALTIKKLVGRHRDPADARAVTLTLTQAGRAEAERLARLPDEFADAMSSLAPEDLAAMLRGMSEMIRSLQDRKAIPVTRMCLTCDYFRPQAHPGTDRPHHCAFVDNAFSDGELRLECPDHQNH
ncbi:MarR family winged helix-turn-helix transcriptional regulator [Actinomadura geliboluensis]|uniref:Winged helix-turn-helix transcriptional regulator n=1 Tax=Actinomadura geliboluensis TaxID=882440 RepID=A0A5S4HAB7_9ACTN|nr:MarR family winged helix-turn-helix transcriptional regulator [Actinomadura geliboluensis]TMR41701.1 winged helix-turn-helix transcriptional regulator [Actinomadura geliboluensis]